MTHILLAAILFVLAYALIWRPWRERCWEATHLREVNRRLYPHLYDAPEPRWHPVTVRCVVCCVVALPLLMLLVRAIYG